MQVTEFSKKRLYRIYNNILTRCYNKKNKAYKNYGARGIILCPEWRLDFIIFYNWAISNGYNDELCIDRIDVNGIYEPSNCRWTNYQEQAKNRRNTTYIEYNGQKKFLHEWAKEANIPQSTLRYKLMTLNIPLEVILKQHAGQRKSPGGRWKYLSEGVDYDNIKNTDILSLKDATKDFQRRYIENTLRVFKNNYTATAEVLCVDRKTLYNLVKSKIVDEFIQFNQE